MSYSVMACARAADGTAHLSHVWDGPYGRKLCPGLERQVGLSRSPEGVAVYAYNPRCILAEHPHPATCIEAGEQPAPVPNENPSIQGMVRADLEARERLGVARYGTVLQAHNGRDALRDAYEEVLDLACCLRQEIAERVETRQGKCDSDDATCRLEVHCFFHVGVHSAQDAFARTDWGGKL